MSSEPTPSGSAHPPLNSEATYKVRLEKERFTFCAAHFITYGENVCEPLHGHNYKVSATIEGPLGPHQYVVDFIAVRDALTAVTRTLDHRVLLPTLHPTIRVVAAEDAVTATFEDRRWVFPAGDCVLLPIESTTAELLARWIGDRLLETLLQSPGFVPDRLEVSVDECDGQAGVCELRPQEM